MSQYIVSARKYRPDSFGTLIGQDNIARTLKNSILRGQLAHAYLFCGPRGVGKTSTARIFAKMINCMNPGPDMEPCGQCESCISFAEGRSYCIHELDAASNNGVDAIKSLMEQVQIPPQVGKYSVYIIDEVHMLSQAAFNAFLKTLEEPPSHAIFILATTEKHKIIPTILSRCQTYDFNRISIPDIVATLSNIASQEEITIDDESLHIIAQKADGAMRDALTIFDQTVAFCGTQVKAEDVMRNLNVLDYEYDFRLVDAFLASDYATALTIFDEVLSKGFNAQYFVSALSSHLRDLLVSRTAGLESLLDLPESLRQRYARQSSSCSLQFLYEALNITTQCEAAYRSSVNPRLHIEFALMKLCFIKGVPVSSAVTAENQPKSNIPAETAESSTTASSKNVSDSPAPAPALKATSSRKRTAGSGLSLKSIMSSDNDEHEAENSVNENVETALPSDEQIREKWVKLAELYPSQPRLASTIANAKLDITESGGLKLLCFSVTNEAQRDWIEQNKLRELETAMRKSLNCKSINLSVKASQYVEKPMAYTPQEKNDELRAANPEVVELIDDLELKLK